VAIGGDEGDGPAVLIPLENCSATAELTADLATRFAQKANAL
jgi:hypothetical protein